jgi:hypothetical protein
MQTDPGAEAATADFRMGGGSRNPGVVKTDTWPVYN